MTLIAYSPRYRLRELVAYRELVGNLTVRDLKLKYKRSVLGAAWSLLNPLIMMAIYTEVFTKFFGNRAPDYWAYVLGGLLVWFFIANALGSATTSLVFNSTLITKVYFPIEALTLSTVLSNFVNFLISLAALLVALLVVGGHLGGSVLLLPIVILALFMFTLGLGLLVGTLTVYFRDIEHLITLGLTALFYLSPVLYLLGPTPGIGAHYTHILRFNPMTWYLECFHAILYQGAWPDPAMLELTLISAPLTLVVGYAVFLRLRSRLPEEV
ncbi:MAG TPA: ABC transporter permease [Candidatus Dormibacteraeota bacterium]|nr:ABC transporter permease [Candidatus Dormibacteraeota bacterium]